MERDTPAKIAGSIAGILQAVGNAMNGQHWLAYVWAGAGLVLASEAFWHARWAQRSSKVAKIIAICTVVAITFLGLLAVTGHPNIKLETKENLFTINRSGAKFVHVRVHNAGPNIAQCNIYLTELRKDGTTFEGFTNANIVLGASLESLEQQFRPQLIPARDYQDFELFEMANNQLLIYGANLDQLPTPPSAPGEYMESIRASGVNCGPLVKTYKIKYTGGLAATWHETVSWRPE